MIDHTYADYWKDINLLAEEVIEECKESDKDIINDYIEELADGVKWVIYPDIARTCIVYSRNSDNYVDNDAYLDTSQGFNSICSQVAHWAFVADLEQEVRKLQENEEEN